MWVATTHDAARRPSRVYIAAPLFGPLERERNLALRDLLAKDGFRTFLPQEDGGVLYDLMANSSLSTAELRQQIFLLDVQAVRDCDAIVCIVDGRVPDEGMCIELGMAYTLGKICIGLKTDSRGMDTHGDHNVMLTGCLQVICETNEAVLRTLASLCGS